jgi:hypothetical protein
MRSTNRHDRNILRQGPLVKIVADVGNDITNVLRALPKGGPTKYILFIDG